MNPQNIYIFWNVSLNRHRVFISAVQKYEAEETQVTLEQNVIPLFRSGEEASRWTGQEASGLSRSRSLSHQFNQ
jgi:hypothetical protein